VGVPPLYTRAARRRSLSMYYKGHLLKKGEKKEESVVVFYVGLRFFGLFCKMLLRVILTPDHLRGTSTPMTPTTPK
jgi:hypothetical protein